MGVLALVAFMISKNSTMVEIESRSSLIVSVKTEPDGSAFTPTITEIAGKGGKVQIRLQDEADYRWTGQIDFTDNTLDNASGAVRMRAVVANPNGFLKPGMFGKAKVEGGQAYEALLVPEDAIVPDGARKAVNVVSPDGTVTLKPVTLGPLSQGLRVIRTGVSANDKIIVNGTARMMMPGQKVKATQVKITPKAAAERTTTVTIPVASSATPAGAQ